MSAGTATMDNWSAGEVGGTFAGVMTLLASIGGGIRWLLNWGDRWAADRETKLARWEESLIARERDYRLTMERELGEVKIEMAQLRDELQTTRSVVVEVTTELRHHAPESEALKRAERLMRAAFPVEYQIPADQAVLVRKLDGEPA